MAKPVRVLLVGAGAIGRMVMRHMEGDPNIVITQIIDHPDVVAKLQREFGPHIEVASSVDALKTQPNFAMECAGHAAVKTHVPALLERGINVALVSVGSLAEPGLAEQLEAAAQRGGAQLTLISGAIAGIDAIASAKVAGLDEVIYTGRKPPIGWVGTPAEDVCDLKTLTTPTIIFEGSAGDAARRFPKNANVAATVSLAGLGLDKTRATLIADPGVSKNIHEVTARGVFGELHIRIAGNPLPDNPKTSALAAYCAVRVLRNVAAALVI
jgi:aspartate dehydrogenase